MKTAKDLQGEALSHLHYRIEQSLLREPKLVTTLVPERFARIPGKLSDHDVEMRTQRYCNSDYEAITLACLYDKEGNIKTVTLIGLPNVGSSLPIIGLDAVAMGKRWALLALDLAATEEQYWDSHCALPLARLHKELGDSIKMRKQPDFAKHSFSQRSIICSVVEGRESIVAEQVGDFFDSEVMKLLDESTPAMELDMPSAAERNLAWRQAERENRKEQKALTSLFGSTIAQCLIEEFLFPIPEYSR